MATARPTASASLSAASASEHRAKYNAKTTSSAKDLVEAPKYGFADAAFVPRGDFELYTKSCVSKSGLRMYKVKKDFYCGLRSDTACSKPTSAGEGVFELTKAERILDMCQNMAVNWPEYKTKQVVTVQEVQVCDAEMGVVVVVIMFLGSLCIIAAFAAYNFALAQSDALAFQRVVMGGDGGKSEAPPRPTSQS